jgi:hypothetical protein
MKLQEEQQIADRLLLIKDILLKCVRREEYICLKPNRYLYYHNDMKTVEGRYEYTRAKMRLLSIEGEKEKYEREKRNERTRI